RSIPPQQSISPGNMSFHGTISRCFHLRSFTQPFIARPKRPSALQQKLLRAAFAAGGRPEFFSGCFIYPKIPHSPISFQSFLRENALKRREIAVETGRKNGREQRSRPFSYFILFHFGRHVSQPAS
ncbi:hypothetical protein, partial [Ruthenibacterium lactatiformans]|uniref:hypothetical protein n=1 Tax=Ruthenibacterium lactatiformans TaxID=1550024 RepID=UPI002666CF22